MEKDYTYGVARIRALERKLFSDDDMTALLQCSDYSQCIAFLKSKGWGNGADSLEKMISIEKKNTSKLIKELSDDSNEMDILMIGDEYHNLKAAIKQVCTDSNNDNIFYEGTKLSPEIIMESIRQGKYQKLPENMEKPAKEAADTLIQTGSGQICDVIIDKAALEKIKEMGENSESKLIRKYADTTVTIANIKIAVRCAATGKNSDFVKKCVVSCDGISIRDLAASVDGGMEGVCTYLESTGFKDGVDALKKSMSVFECWCDNKIVQCIKSEKYNSFTVGPIIAYAIAKEMEIKTIRIILTCKLNGFDNGFIRERMREMYV